MKVCPIFMSPLSLNDSKSKMRFLIHFGIPIKGHACHVTIKSQFDPLATNKN